MPDWGFANLLTPSGLSLRTTFYQSASWHCARNTKINDFMTKVGENELVLLVQAGPLEAKARRCEPNIDACLDLLFSGQTATDRRLRSETVRSVT